MIKWIGAAASQCLLILIILLTPSVRGQFDPHFVEDRSVIVHLFEWKWVDVARECESFLGPLRYAGVQVSPPNENSVIRQRPWWERYQPVSYLIHSRSGDEDAFRDMVKRCAAVGVRVYVDAVINHMSATSGRGTGGSISDPTSMNYPAVPYTSIDFHPPCEILNYNDPVQVRNCQLVGLPDLNQTLNYVQDRIVEYLNKLIDCGVAGFRVDAAKHMWPEDLKRIYARLNDLKTAFGFAANQRPFVYQEVIDMGGEGVSRSEYTSLGRVTEFRASADIGRSFRDTSTMGKLRYMDSWGTGWGFMESGQAVVFVENHDNERGDGAGGGDVLTYKDARQYKMAVAFTLAHPYAIPKVMSSFEFERSDQGPPAGPDGEIISPRFDTFNCLNGWVCQHRWRQIYNMVRFRDTVKDAPLSNWWAYPLYNQIAFSRKGRGFIAFNSLGSPSQVLHEKLATGLPMGTYCDIISGALQNNTCTGKTVNVDVQGSALILIRPEDEDGVVAIHIDAKLN